MASPKEPPRITSIESLHPEMQVRVRKLLARMKSLGYDPVIFEARRTHERQQWLYGVGRTHSLHRKPVTWTLRSKHLEGKAVDIISKSRLWNWPKFYAVLGREARALGLKRIPRELCHVEM